MVEFTATAILGCTIPNADPFLPDVVLLMGFEGSSGSTGSPGMNDESPHLWGTAQFGAANGLGSGAVISTSHPKFGASSLSLNGSSIIRFLGNLALNELGYLTFGANHFTVEMFIYPNSVTGTQFLCGRWQDVGSISWIFYLSGTSLWFNLSTTGSDNLSVVSGGTVTTGAQQHVCVDYDGTKYRVYLNGTMVGSTTATHTIYDPGFAFPQLSIGGNSLNTGFWYNGFIDELRITNGAARYATDGSFIVPTSAFPRS
jgi:Concanavalin A-like lectin/glucanases superfamily